jgi:valyl-tRNA synthetase
MLDEVRALDTSEQSPPAATAVCGALTLLVPMAGLIDPASERQRLDKRLQKLEQELARAQHKLANEAFVNNAPPEVVAQERERLHEFERARDRLQHQRSQVQELLHDGGQS